MAVLHFLYFMQILNMSASIIVQAEEVPPRRKKRAPEGLQEVLIRLAKVALTNSPCCYYECFAEALEADLDRRTLSQLQLSSCY
jgi:hypothetical protein